MWSFPCHNGIKLKSYLPPGIVQIAVGEHHDLALTATGAVYQWGDVGVGLRQSRRLKKTKLEPHRVIFRGGARIEKVWAGGHASFARDRSGAIWAWGPNNYNQLGIPSEQNSACEDGVGFACCC